MSSLRLAGMIPESFVDGPGIRFVLFAQGCNHHCEGCHNPETHDYESGQVYDLNSLYKRIKTQKHITGVTLSGGEPFDQAVEFAKLAQLLKKDGLNIVTYTGYKLEYILGNTLDIKGWKELLETTDILIDGPYIHELRDISIAFRGSTNQRLVDVPQTLAQGMLVEFGEKLEARR